MLIIIVPNTGWKSENLAPQGNGHIGPFSLPTVTVTLNKITVQLIQGDKKQIGILPGAKHIFEGRKGWVAIADSWDEFGNRIELKQYRDSILE